MPRNPASLRGSGGARSAGGTSQPRSWSGEGALDPGWAPRAGLPRWTRRTLLITLAAAPAVAARPPAHRIARINWPASPGRLLHGVLAIPARARGPQPAVLVLGDAAAPDALVAYLLERLADAGLVACALDLAAGHVAIDVPPALDDALATIEWLRRNRYATGKVGVFGVGHGATLALRLAAAAGDRLTAAVALGGEALPPTPAIRAALLAEALAAAPDPVTLAPAWTDLLARATAFLKEHLA